MTREEIYHIQVFVKTAVAPLSLFFVRRVDGVICRLYDVDDGLERALALRNREEVDESDVNDEANVVTSNGFYIKRYSPEQIRKMANWVEQNRDLKGSRRFAHAFDNVGDPVVARWICSPPPRDQMPFDQYIQEVRKTRNGRKE